MKKIQLLCVCVSLSLANSVSSFAQLLISGKDVEEALNSTAILQLDSTEKGFLMPRMTNVQRRMIANPVKGLQVYVTDFNSEEGTIMFYDDEKWKVFTQLSSRPDPPTEVTVSSDSDIGQAIITFKTPEEDGGSPITSYTAKSNNDGKTGTTTTVDSSGEGSIQINGLSSGNHAFEVTATNAIGSSEMGTSSTINIDGLNSPDPPTNVMASLSSVAGQAIITFKAPVKNGGSPITHYTVNSSSEASSGETHNPIPANTLQEDQFGNLIIEFNDLSSGNYTFGVTATNAIGSSALSTTSNIINIRKIGDYYQGGVVFYLLQEGEEGYDPEQTHGLVCAIKDQSSGIQWYNGSNISTGATELDVGSGSDNTNAIISEQGATETDYAAGLAKACTDGGYSDWFLPSDAELNLMCQNSSKINSAAKENGGESFSDGSFYWSSTEFTGNNEYSHARKFPIEGAIFKLKSETYLVRPVRSF